MAKRSQLGTNQNAEAIGKDEQLKPRVHIPDWAGEVMGKSDELYPGRSPRSYRRWNATSSSQNCSSRGVRVGAQAERLVVRRLEPRH
jgi:hypothetical protein